LEQHNWYYYENSERCDAVEGTVPVKVFTVRHLNDIRRSYVFGGYLGKNFYGCPMTVLEYCSLSYTSLGPFGITIPALTVYTRMDVKLIY
jgi:hypothetical protein